MSPTVGTEIHKSRPAVFVSEDAISILPLRVMVPITEWKERYDQPTWMVAITPSLQNGLEKHSAADAFQIRSVSQKRFMRQLGLLEDEFLTNILGAIQTVIGTTA